MTDKGNHASTEDESKASMWTFQRRFQPLVVREAQKVFDCLDSKLKPSVFLVGIPIQEESAETAVCLEPADECGYQPESFSVVMESAKQLDEEDEAKRPFARPSAEEGKERKIPNEAIQRAIQKVLSKTDNERGVVSYCSLPTTVIGHKVCCVLQIDAKALKSHYSLRVKRDSANRRLPESLIDSAAIEFLKVCSKALRERNAGRDLDALGRDPEEILRAAGRELTFRAAYAASGPMLNIFDVLNIISSKHHEGEKAGGAMLLVTPEHPDFQMPVAFKEWVKLREHGAARKILEMARNVSETNEEKRFYLLSTGDSIYGIGRMNENYERDFSEIYIVKFTGHYSWELIHLQDDKVMMDVHYGNPSLPKKPFDKEVFRDHVERIFTTTTRDVDALWCIVEKAAEQEHGTMIVISSAAQSEAERLADQSTLIAPAPLTEKDIVLMLTSIDGAVLVDPAGTCHAAGVILDGKAIPGKGTRARGARYNSAIRYIDSEKEENKCLASEEEEKECLAIVISEDGMINLWPDLKPRIRRSEIVEHVEKVRDAVNTEVVNSKQYYRAMDWLSGHRFYLPEAVCSELNEIQGVTKQRPGSSTTWADFKPNPEMNDSYFSE